MGLRTVAVHYVQGRKQVVVGIDRKYVVGDEIERRELKFCEGRETVRTAPPSHHQESVTPG